MVETNFLFYGISIHVTGSQQIISRLEKDFEYFKIINSNPFRYDFNLFFYQDSPDYDQLNGLVSIKQSFNSITFQKDHIRYNDYYGEALSIYDYSKDEGFVYSSDLNRLHEIAYLLILSRIGKRLDRKGLHRVHAMAVGYKETALVVMMPMKGGKSTLFLDLISNPDIEIISDDSPIIDHDGSILPFPLRVGFHDSTQISDGDKSLLYSVHRKQYGEKKLAPVSYFQNKIGSRYKKVILCDGVRSHSDDCLVIKAGKISALKALQKHMVVGVGLPLIIEYFFENTIKDLVSNVRNFISRLYHAVKLSRRSDFYHLQLGFNKSKNAKKLYQLLRDTNG